MGKLQKILGAITLGLGMNDCGPIEDKIEFLEGKVVKERGNIISGGQFENPSYVLSVDTEKGAYVMDVLDSFGSKRSIYALAEVIEVGDKIRFVLGRGNYTKNPGKSCFSSDKIGYNYKNNISMVEKAKIEREK